MSPVSYIPLDVPDRFHPRAVYRGDSSGLSECCDHGPEWEDRKGNSIALDMGNGIVVYIGEIIFSFQVGEAEELAR
jgi:hypothetical protein